MLLLFSPTVVLRFLLVLSAAFALMSSYHCVKNCPDSFEGVNQYSLTKHRATCPAYQDTQERARHLRRTVAQARSEQRHAQKRPRLAQSPSPQSTEPVLPSDDDFGSLSAAVSADISAIRICLHLPFQ